MSATLIDAGHHEEFHKDKHLSVFCSIISTSSEPRTHKGPISPEVLKGIKSLWFFGPKRDLVPEEANVLEQFAIGGGSIFILCSRLPGPIFENFCKKYGVTINETVISPTYIQYIDPHQVTVQHGMVNRALSQYTNDQNSTFAYSKGSNLEVTIPSVPVLTSGQSSYPLNRPIISHAHVGNKGGSVIVCGTSQIFSDEWVKKESNEQLLKFLIDLTINKTVELNKIDAEHPEVTERWYTPDVMSMSEKLRSCIQESEKMRGDFTQNFERGLFRMDMSFVHDAQQVASTLGLKNEPLETVTPQFDTALPPLTPAVFPPQMREPNGPVLELFDLDDAFALPKTRLAQLAQRTPPKNVEKFIIQSAKILGILPRLSEDKKSGKHVLEYVFSQVVRWKRQSND